MASGNWKEFRFNGIRFDILQGQFVRIRYRKGDQGTQKAYLVVDIVVRRPLLIELYEDGELVEQVTLGEYSLPSQSTR